MYLHIVAHGKQQDMHLLVGFIKRYIFSLVVTNYFAWSKISAADIDHGSNGIGGHDLYTSLAQLETLWRNEINVVKIMEELSQKLENNINIMKDYIASTHHHQQELHQSHVMNWKRDNLDQVFDVLGDLEDIASRWYSLNVDIQFDNISDSFAHLASYTKEKLPDESDIEVTAKKCCPLKHISISIFKHCKH